MKRWILFIGIFFLLSLSPLPIIPDRITEIQRWGDWYANPTSLPNLVNFANKNLGTNISDDVATVDVGSPEIFNYPFVHMTGHGNVIFSAQEQKNSGITLSEEDSCISTIITVWINSSGHN